MTFTVMLILLQVGLAVFSFVPMHGERYVIADDGIF